MATVRELTEREVAIARAYAKGTDLGVIATQRDEEPEAIRRVLDLFNLSRTAARDAVISGRVTVRGELPVDPSDRRRRAGVETQRRHAATVAAGVEPLTVTLPVTESAVARRETHGTVLAEYNAARCPECRWIGVDGHAHPTRPVTVQIVTREVD